jgi:alpha/beta superfamily hydrolase
MSTQSFKIKNPQGEHLDVCVHGSIQNTMILSCHGMLADKESPKHTYLTKTLAKKGLASARFDFSGRGQSEGSLYELCLSKQISDLDAVIAASRDERIAALATLAASAHPDEINMRHPQVALQFSQQGYMEIPEGKIGPTFYEDLFAYDVVRAISILRIPTYILHGERDEVVPVADALDLGSAARNTRVEVIPEADHRLSNPVQEREIMNSICEFFIETFSDINHNH